ncbi:MAG: hypothetical protein ACRDCG_00125 [Mycoplasmoidaceae bacterium]
MSFTKKQFFVIFLFSIIIYIFGMIANLTASFILKDYAYIYGWLIGSSFIWFWVLFYWFFLKSIIKANLSEKSKKDLWLQFTIFLVIRWLLIIFPFVIGSLVFWLGSHLINGFSMLSTPIIFMLIINVFNVLYFYVLCKSDMKGAKDVESL